MYHIHQTKKELAHPTPQELESWQVPVKQITTNTGGGGIVQMKLIIQADNPKSLSRLKSDTADIRSEIISILHSVPIQDFDKSSGFTTIRKRLVTGVRKILPHTNIKTVYITHMIFQA